MSRTISILQTNSKSLVSFKQFNGNHNAFKSTSNTNTNIKNLFTSTSSLSLNSTSNSNNVSSIIPSPRHSISTPQEFITAISKLPRRNLVNNPSVVSAVGEDWEKMFQLNRNSLKGAGVGIKDRRYLLWALEKFRQGLDPKEYAIDPKPKKKVRGWGPRVQNGIRVSGRKRPGEK